MFHTYKLILKWVLPPCCIHSSFRLNSTIAQFGRLKRQVYAKRYPLRIVNKDGSCYDVMFKEPRAIFHLPHNMSALTGEAKHQYLLERKSRLKRQSVQDQKTEVETVDFDHDAYNEFLK